MTTGIKNTGIVISAVALALTLGTIVYRAGQMPTAEEVKEIRDRGDAKIESVRSDVAGIERTQGTIQTDVAVIKESQVVFKAQQDTIERKLDRALEARRPR